MKAIIIIILLLSSCTPKIFPDEQIIIYHVNQRGDTTLLDSGDIRILQNYIFIDSLDYK